MCFRRTDSQRSADTGFAAVAAESVIFMDHGQIVEQNAQDVFSSHPQTDRVQDFLSKILGR